jgi:DNA-binding response OmpR family regulator
VKKAIKILLIEDNPADAKYVAIQLNKSFNVAYTLQTRDYFSKGVFLCEKSNFDVIILDLSLPDTQGLMSIETLSKSCNAPIIIYTGLSDELIKAEALKNGASDYLLKGKTSSSELKESILAAIEKYHAK